jgi:hypothetical protein
MKIESADEFKPVIITLQSQEELDLFTEVFYRVGGHRFRDGFGGRTSTVVELLRSKGGNCDQMNASGSIDINYFN